MFGHCFDVNEGHISFNKYPDEFANYFEQDNLTMDILRCIKEAYYDEIDSQRKKADTKRKGSRRR